MRVAGVNLALVQLDGAARDGKAQERSYEPPANIDI